MSVGWFNWSMEAPRPPLRISFARVCRTVRASLGLSQQRLATTAGVSRGFIAAIESGRGNPSLDVVERIAEALGLVVDPVFRPPSVLGDQWPVDALHARCLGQAERRLRTAGWRTAREVEVVHARSHGWIDLLAFHPGTGTLLVIEVKTRLDDLGAIERQLGWYERSAFAIARRLGWTPRRAVPWLIVLGTAEAEAIARQNRELLETGFPARAREMLEVASGANPDRHLRRGFAMIDPASRRQEWLLRTPIDGRRSPAPYLDPRDAARKLRL